MTNWPIWELLPALIAIIATGGIGLAIILMTILELIGRAPKNHR